MSRHFVRVLPAFLCAAVTLTLGCDGATPSAPAPPTPPLAQPVPPEPSTVRVWTIAPNTGSTDGRTPVLINGAGFSPGATVTLDGTVMTNVTVVSNAQITATTSAHGPGTVDVVVSNPDGQSGRLSGAYAYALAVSHPPPSIAAVAPNVGTTGGGGEIRIIGAGFQPGAIVRLDDTQLHTYTHGASSTTLDARVSAHAVGTVDLVLTNPDGQSATLSAGYRYAAPGTLDFSGQWKGIADDRRDDHSSTEVALTIENNKVISISCNSAVTSLSPPPPVSNDEFSFSAADRILVSGRFTSAIGVVGRIDLPPCGLTWGASKQQ